MNQYGILLGSGSSIVVENGHIQLLRNKPHIATNYLMKCDILVGAITLPNVTLCGNKADHGGLCALISLYRRDSSS